MEESRNIVPEIKTIISNQTRLDVAVLLVRTIERESREKIWQLEEKIRIRNIVLDKIYSETVVCFCLNCFTVHELPYVYPPQCDKCDSAKYCDKCVIEGNIGSFTWINKEGLEFTYICPECLDN